MSTATPSPLRREQQLAGQTVVVIGGSAGIGLETARLANAEGATLVLGARNPERLQHVAGELTATTTVAFDATDFERLGQFFDELPAPIDHLLLTGPGPYYAPLAEFDFEKARRDIEAHMLLPLCSFRCNSPVTPQTKFAREAHFSSWAAPVGAALRKDSL